MKTKQTENSATQLLMDWVQRLVRYFIILFVGKFKLVDTTEKTNEWLKKGWRMFDVYTENSHYAGHSGAIRFALNKPSWIVRLMPHRVYKFFLKGAVRVGLGANNVNGYKSPSLFLNFFGYFPITIDGGFEGFYRQEFSVISHDGNFF